MQGHRVRLAKLMASAGIASRRRCEEYIRAGKVTVNGVVVEREATLVDVSVDQVQYCGLPVGIPAKVCIALYKPVGVTCSMRDDHADALISEFIPEQFGRLFPVGRLDRDSEGLLLLTNDGDLAQHVTHPSYMVEKTYVVTCGGAFPHDGISAMTRGIDHRGERLRARSVDVLDSAGERHVLKITLTQGKKREIRRMCRALGLEVLRLLRIRIGLVELDDLVPGEWRQLSVDETASLIAH